MLDNVFKIKKRNVVIDITWFDYELENGVLLHKSEWNGECYEVDGIRYFPVQEEFMWDDDCIPYQWNTVGFEERR